MKTLFRWIAAISSSLLATAAIAAFHTYQIEQIFSNASGTVQFIVMHESQGMSAEYFWANNTISTSAPMTYRFPSNLPIGGGMCGVYGCGYAAPSSTANTRVLIATQGFANLGILAPDFIVPDNFIPVGGGMINYAGVDQVSFGPLPTDGVTAINRAGAKMQNVATNFTGASASVAAASGVDLSQHGLTGSWYKPATSGQGVEVEVFPNQAAPGTGSVFVSWFTYDNVVGGADHERWYTASGPVASGQPNAALTIYQNVGGNFNAAPITSAQPVGTATLSFDTCTSGQLSYNFTDGTGRQGSIALTRLTQNVTCALAGALVTTNSDFAHSGNWYDPMTSGQGFTVEINPVSGAVFAAWYTYAPNGAGAGAAGQRWYTAQQTAPFVPGTRSIPVAIYESTGGMFDAPAAVNTAQVGTGTLAFQSCSAATFNYSFTGGPSSGMSGSIVLSRVGPVPPGCS
jgi:hypothetical protein